MTAGPRMPWRPGDDPLARWEITASPGVMVFAFQCVDCRGVATVGRAVEPGMDPPRALTLADLVRKAWVLGHPYPCPPLPDGGPVADSRD